MNKAPRHGFTLVELLVVISIIGLLAALLFPALRRAVEQARRVKCEAQCHQIWTLMIGLANTRGDKVDIGPWPPGGRWLWDMDRPTFSQMFTTNNSSFWYCPSCRTEQQGNAGNALWNYKGYIIVGYWLGIARTDNGVPDLKGRMVQTTADDKDVNVFIYRFGTLSNPARTMLAADATISKGLDFRSGITGGAPNPHFSPHYTRGNKAPDGGNVTYADGHTGWVPFSKMQTRFTSPESWW